MSDIVNHPPHYKAGGLEAIDVIEAFDLNFRLGNVVKYILRHGAKGNPQADLKKAGWYLSREISAYAPSLDNPMEPSGFSYLATSYTRRSQRTVAFAEAASLCARLALKGVIAFSPIAHGHPMSEYGGIDFADGDWWLNFNAPFMAAASSMLVVHDAGWKESRGIAEEVKVFDAAGKPIFDLDPVSLVMTRRQK